MRHLLHRDDTESEQEKVYYHLDKVNQKINMDIGKSKKAKNVYAN